MNAVIGQDRYRIIRGIGRGGTADVFEAFDQSLHRSVAVKIFHERFARDGSLLSRLRREISVVRMVSSPYVVAVYAFYEEETKAYLVMELMRGGDLFSLLKNAGRMAPAAVESLAVDMLKGLADAHDQGVIHRDIKPRNILFAESRTAKLSDFGLARSVSIAGLSEQGHIVGTPEYMAPESIVSGLWDARSDLYAIGCTLYECLTGRSPFRANDAATIMRMHAEAPVPALDEDMTHSHPRLVELVLRLLRKDPNDRPQTSREALQILEGAAPQIDLYGGDQVRCHSCGAPLSADYPWCFACGESRLPVSGIKKGGVMVLVTGPGRSGEKLDSDLRDRCVEIAGDSGLDTRGLEQQVPRLPFILATRLESGGAVRLSHELVRAGIQSQVMGINGTPKRAVAAQIVKKSMTMAPRFYAVFAGMSGGFFHFILRIPAVAIITTIGAVLVGVPLVTTATYLRPVARAKAKEPGVSAAVKEVLARAKNPLIHARMRAICRAVHAVRQVVAGDDRFTESEARLVYEWTDAALTKAANLSLAIEELSEARTLANEAGDGGEVRRVDAITNRVFESIGRTALEIHEYAGRLAQVYIKSLSPTIGDLQTTVKRLEEEQAAWRELETV